MAKDMLDTEYEGQMTIADLFEPPERLFAVSRIFARARKDMSLAEQKAFVYALSELHFTEEAKTPFVRLDKKTLANIVGIHSDPDHLSVDLFDEIRDLPKHSYIEIREKDLDFFSSGFVVTNITSFKNLVRIRFNEDYLPLFTNLSNNYITMWSLDIFQMKSRRSVQFYEFLRQVTDSRKKVNDIALGIKALKEIFDIPKEAYMREKGGFDRANFERYVILPLCDDLAKCKMVNLVIQPDGKPYEKVKRGNRVAGYRFFWTFTDRPAVASAKETAEIQERVDKNPQVLKVAKDLLNGEKKKSKNDLRSKHGFKQHDYDFDELKRQFVNSPEPAEEEKVLERHPDANGEFWITVSDPETGKEKRIKVDEEIFRKVFSIKDLE